MEARSAMVSTSIALLLVGVAAVVTLLVMDTRSASHVAAVQEQASHRISATFSSVDSLSFQMIANADVNETLASYGSDPLLYSSAPADMRFSEFIESQVAIRSFLVDAVFFDYDEPRRTPLTMTENLRRPDFGSIDESLRGLAEEGDGAVMWLASPLMLWERPHIASARLIKPLGGGEPIGFFVALIDARDIGEILDSVGGDEGEARSTSLLVSSSGVVIAGTEASLIGVSAKDALGDEWRAASADAKGSRRVVARYDGRLAALQTYRDTTYGLSLVTILPIGPIVLRALLGATALLCAFGFIALSGFSIHLRRASAIPGMAATLYRLPPGTPPLTSRETDILERLVRGMSNKEIAFQLGLKEQTVKNCLGRLYGKLGVHDRLSALLSVRLNSEDPRA